MGQQQRALMVPRPRAIALVVSVALVAAWIGASSQDAERPLVVAAVALATLSTFALLRTAPVVALAASLGAPLLASWIGGAAGSDDPYLVLIVVASYGVGRFARYRDQPYIAAGVLALTSLNVAAPGPFALPQQLIFPVLLTVAPWVLGVVVRRASESEGRALDFAAELEATRRADLEEATLGERLRVARELHDITAHTMNVVSLQAQVLRRRRERGEEIHIGDLRAIEASARQAMTELRQVLGALRPMGESGSSSLERSIQHLPELVAQCRSAGQTIEFVVTGEARDLSASGSLAAYRIVQESLTNARRHGAPGPVHLTLAWRPGELELCTTNPIREETTIDEPSSGVGLVGIRERLHLCGGQLEVGRLEPERWVMRATLPTLEAS